MWALPSRAKHWSYRSPCCLSARVPRGFIVLRAPPSAQYFQFHVHGRGSVLYVRRTRTFAHAHFLIIMAEYGSLLFQVETNEVLTYTNTTISEFTNNYLQDSEDEDEVIRKQEVNVHL